MRDHKVYIIPTRYGLAYLLGIALMLLVGAAHANNSVNMLAFFLLSLAFITMVQTHHSVRDMHLHKAYVDSGFAGGEIVVHTMLVNRNSEPRGLYRARVPKLKASREFNSDIVVRSGEVVHLQTSYHVEKRGRFSIKRITLSSVYPVGLFRAWKYVPAELDYFVYPKPVNRQKLPIRHKQSEDIALGMPVSGEDFYGHRRYHQGDSQHHIDWKARARGRPLLVKDFREQETPSVILDYYLAAGADAESKLSQLSAWVEQAHKSNQPFELILPGQRGHLDRGHAHAVRCWQDLAVFSEAQNV